MGNGEKPKPARVPNAAPQILKDFVRCNQDEITLDSTEVDWMPTGPFGDFAPSPTVGAGSSPNTATLGYGTLEFPSSIGVDGQLVVDTSSVPSDGIFSFLEDAIQEWVKAFNETMKANEKGLEHLEVKGTKITLTKETVGAAPDETAVTAPPPVIPVPAPEETEPSPESEAGDEADNGGCKLPFIGILFLLLLVVAAIVLGAVALFSGGGNDDDVVATDAAAEETTADESALNTVPEPEITEDAEAPAGADADEPPTVVEEPPAPPYQVGGELWQIDLEEGEVWDVAAREAQGSFPFEGTVELFVRDQPVNGGFLWMAHVSPLNRGAFELWLFDDETSEQTGSTPFLGESFDTFGAGQGEGNSHPCGDGALFFGTSPGDPRLRSSWGVTIYVPLDSDQGFDDGTTGAVGDFLGGIPGSPVVFDVDPGDRTIRGDTWESPTNGCLNDPDIGDDVLGADFFSVGGGGQLDVLQGDAAFPDLDLGGVQGEVVAAILDDRTDTVDCGDNVTPLDNPGADIFGLIVFRDSDTGNVAVVMTESPLATRQEDWSSSVNLQTVSEGGIQHVYITEFHDGAEVSGELVDGAIDPAGVETRLTDDAVLFTFPLDPNDPLGLAAALSLDTPDEGDSKACDDIIGDIGIFADGFESGDTSAWSTGR